MKTITLCYSFIRKNLVPILITTLMMTISMFILATFIGEYRYTAYTRDVIQNDHLKNGGYFMTPGQGIDTGDLQKEIQQHEACKHILTFETFPVETNNIFTNVQLYDRNMREGFPLHVNKGRWLSSNPTETEAVIGGVVWGNIKVGDTIDLGNNITAKVVGVMGDCVYYPKFNQFSNTAVDSGMLFGTNDTVVFLTKETVPVETIEKVGRPGGRHFYVVFKDDATAEEKNDLISIMEAQGKFADYDSIIRDSNEKIRTWVAGALPLPLFLLIVSTISIVSISTVVIKRAMPEYSRYYLIGCSKRRGIGLIVMPMGTIFSIPCILNLASVLFFPHFLRAGRSTAAVDYLFDAATVVPLVLYFVLIVVLMIVIPTMFYKKYSPLSFYRSNL